MTDEPQTRTNADGSTVTGRYLDADADGQPDVMPGADEPTPATVLQRIPTPVRLTLYGLAVVGGPVLIYLQAKGIIGADEWSLYAALCSVFGVTAAGNVTR